MGDVTQRHPVWRQHGSVGILTDKVDEIAWIKRAGQYGVPGRYTW